MLTCPGRAKGSAMSLTGTSLQFAATQQFSRFRSEADIQRAGSQNRIYEYAP